MVMVARYSSAVAVRRYRVQKMWMEFMQGILFAMEITFDPQETIHDHCHRTIFVA